MKSVTLADPGNHGSERYRSSCQDGRKEGSRLRLKRKPECQFVRSVTLADLLREVLEIEEAPRGSVIAILERPEVRHRLEAAITQSLGNARLRVRTIKIAKTPEVAQRIREVRNMRSQGAFSKSLTDRPARDLTPT
jgi:hypothetical protein